MAIVEVSIVPIGTGEPSISRYVARAVSVLEKSEISYEISPMGTILHGELGKILEVIKDMHESCFSEGIVRVLTTIKIDDRRDRYVSPQDKVRSVREKLHSTEE